LTLLLLGQNQLFVRPAKTLASAAQSIRDRHGISLDALQCDIASDEGRAVVSDKAGQLDILVHNTDGPQLGDFRAWARKT